MPAVLDAAAVPEELPAMLDEDAAMILFPRRLQSFVQRQRLWQLQAGVSRSWNAMGQNEGPECQRNQEMWTRTEQRLSACRHLQLRGPTSLSAWTSK